MEIETTYHIRTLIPVHRDNDKWVAIDDMNNLVDDIYDLMLNQYEAMDNLRQVHQLDIQDKHWTVPYISALIEMQQKLDKFRKELNTINREKVN